MAENNHLQDTPEEVTRALLQRLMNLYPNPAKGAAHVSFNRNDGNYSIEFPSAASTEPRTQKAWQEDVVNLFASLDIGIGSVRMAYSTGGILSKATLSPEGPVDDKIRKAIEDRMGMPGGEKISEPEIRTLYKNVRNLARCFTKWGRQSYFLDVRGSGGRDVIVTYPGTWGDNIQAISDLIRAIHKLDLIDNPKVDPERPLITKEFSSLKDPALPILPVNIGNNLMVDLDDKGRPQVTFTLPKGRQIGYVIGTLTAGFSTVKRLKTDAAKEPAWADRVRRISVGNPLENISEEHARVMRDGRTLTDRLQKYLKARFQEIFDHEIFVTYNHDKQCYDIDTMMSDEESRTYFGRLQGEKKDKFNALCRVFPITSEDTKIISPVRNQINGVAILEINAAHMEQLAERIKEHDYLGYCTHIFRSQPGVARE